MRRVLVFLEYKAKWWEDKVGSAPPSGSEGSESRAMVAPHTEGLHAYAFGQARVMRDLAKKFDAMWGAVRRDQVDNAESQGGGADESEDELDGADEGSEEEEMEENKEAEADMDEEEFTYDD